MVLWKEFPGSIFMNGFIGRNEKDFFVYGDGVSHLMHYNGTDLQTLFTTEFWFYDYQIFEKDVFVFAEDPVTEKKIVIRGTLKDK